MLNLHEYQAKALFQSYGMPVLESYVASTPTEALDAAEKLSTVNAVVKAQIQAGGRGSAGGVKLVDTPHEAADYAESILGTHLVTHQTDAAGQVVNSVMVEEICDIARELYLGVIFDRTSPSMVITISPEAEVDIEGLVRETPPLTVDAELDAKGYLKDGQATELAAELKLQGHQIEQFNDLLTSLCRLLKEKELTQIEIDPLVITNEGNLICLNPKIHTGRTLLSY